MWETQSENPKFFAHCYLCHCCVCPSLDDVHDVWMQRVRNYNIFQIKCTYHIKSQLGQSVCNRMEDQKDQNPHFIDQGPASQTGRGHHELPQLCGYPWHSILGMESQGVTGVLVKENELVLLLTLQFFTNNEIDWIT